MERNVRARGIRRLQVSHVELVPHVREIQDSRVEALPVPVRPHLVAVVLAHEFGEPAHGRPSRGADAMPDPLTNRSPQTAVGLRDRRYRQRRSWRCLKEFVTVEVVGIGHLNIHLGSRVRPRHRKHVLPFGVVASRREGRCEEIRGSRVVLGAKLDESKKRIAIATGFTVAVAVYPILGSGEVPCLEELHGVGPDIFPALALTIVCI